MIRWLDGLEPWGLLLLRLVLGVAMVYHGWNKVIPAHGLHGLPLSALARWSHLVAAMGLPPWMGYVSALTEFLGGALLVLGLLTRFSAFLVAINMLVALFAVNVRRGYGGSEYSMALAAMAILLVLAGGGAASVDRKLGLR